MLECLKQWLRDIFNFMSSADSVVVAGHAPAAAPFLGNIANQCFLHGGIGFGALSFCYYLMFLKGKGSKELVYVYPEPLLHESEIRFCAISSK